MSPSNGVNNLTYEPRRAINTNIDPVLLTTISSTPRNVVEQSVIIQVFKFYPTIETGMQVKLTVPVKHTPP